ncbi:hypothetical protein OROHE_025721 [Orobanche hederae]
MTTEMEEYIDRIYTDRMSGDVMLIGPGHWRKTKFIVDGMLFEVDTQLIGIDSMRESFEAAIDGLEYDGPLDKGKIVIDLVRMHQLVEISLPNKVQFTNYLTYYLDHLIPFLEKDKALVRNLGGSVVCAHYEGGYDPTKAPNLLYLTYGLKSEVYIRPQPCRDESESESAITTEEHDESDIATSAESDAATSSSKKRMKKKVGKTGRRGRSRVRS